MANIFELFRLGDFLPAALVPPSAVPGLIAALLLLCVSIYSLTCASQHEASLTLLRLSLVTPSICLFWEWGYGPHDAPANQVSVGLAVVGLYGIMRVIETTFVPFIDPEPPRWVVDGRELPLPTGVLERLAYTFDLVTSLRGTSWFPHTHWNWAPKALVHSPTEHLAPSEFLKRAVVSIARQYLALDILDTLNKSRRWDKSIPNPITSLPVHEQLAFSLSVCAGTALAITVPFTIISFFAVLLGSSPAAWPPMFDDPFTATSLVDFWTRRWHAIFRRVFERLSRLLLFVLPIPASRPVVRRTTRAVVIFALSAGLHIMLMYRLDHDYRNPPDHPHGTFLDSSILAFFLSQPAGLALEAAVVIPLSRQLPERWRVTFTRVWAWTFMLWAGRFWSDVWVRRGLWDEPEKVVGYSVVRGLLWGKWIV